MPWLGQSTVVSKESEWLYTQSRHFLVLVSLRNIAYGTVRVPYEYSNSKLAAGLERAICGNVPDDRGVPKFPPLPVENQEMDPLGVGGP